jgi:hypothetical protein
VEHDMVGPALHLVCAVSDKAVLHRELMASPDLSGGGRGIARVVLIHGARSAAHACNPVLQRLAHRAGSALDDDAGAAPWVVWVHQDVWLPAGWAAVFTQGLQDALRRWPDLAVAGVYGLSGVGEEAVRAGDVWDRGSHLVEPTALPCTASSLDELLVAVRADRGLLLDPELGFDFYATDLCLQARARGLTAAVLHAPVRHASSTPREGLAPRRVLDRIARSGEVFERKWAAQLPVFTPCFEIRQAGDVRAFIEQHFEAVDEGHG